mmetsp:Transcript_31810/g.92412  ORF Transcript_31810/g.92412 Transcript_31810/m.92412 type:complete len:559 (-) Transcript_31810:65-1741(-)
MCSAGEGCVRDDGTFQLYNATTSTLSSNELAQRRHQAVNIKGVAQRFPSSEPRDLAAALDHGDLDRAASSVSMPERRKPSKVGDDAWQSPGAALFGSARSSLSSSGEDRGTLEVAHQAETRRIEQATSAGLVQCFIPQLARDSSTPLSAPGTEEWELAKAVELETGSRTLSWTELSLDFVAAGAGGPIPFPPSAASTREGVMPVVMVAPSDKCQLIPRRIPDGAAVAMPEPASDGCPLSQSLFQLQSIGVELVLLLSLPPPGPNDPAADPGSPGAVPYFQAVLSRPLPHPFKIFDPLNLTTLQRAATDPGTTGESHAGMPSRREAVVAQLRSGNAARYLSLPVIKLGPVASARLASHLASLEAERPESAVLSPTFAHLVLAESPSTTQAWKELRSSALGGSRLWPRSLEGRERVFAAWAGEHGRPEWWPGMEAAKITAKDAVRAFESKAQPLASKERGPAKDPDKARIVEEMWRQVVHDDGARVEAGRATDDQQEASTARGQPASSSSSTSLAGGDGTRAKKGKASKSREDRKRERARKKPAKVASEAAGRSPQKDEL